jgi:hypothetical protein
MDVVPVLAGRDLGEVASMACSSLVSCVGCSRARVVGCSWARGVDEALAFQWLLPGIWLCGHVEFPVVVATELCGMSGSECEVELPTMRKERAHPRRPAPASNM